MMGDWYKSFVEQYGAQCPICRTTLQAQSPACPRCRNTCKLGLKVIEAYLVAWGLMAAALSLQAGLGIFLLYLILRRPYFRGVEMAVFLGIGILGVVSGIGLALLLIFRRPFCGIPRWAQWLAAILALFMLAASTALFMLFLR